MLELHPCKQIRQTPEVLYACARADSRGIFSAQHHENED